MSEQRDASLCVLLTGKPQGFHTSLLHGEEKAATGCVWGGVFQHLETVLQETHLSEMLGEKKVPRRQTYCGPVPEARLGYVWKFPQPPVLKDSGFIQ